MPTNKQALIRYFALDRCFSSTYRFYFIEDLIKECNEALYNNTGLEKYADPLKPGISRRQILNDIAFMESSNGYNAPIQHCKMGKRVYFRYEDKSFSIRKAPITDEEILQLQSTLRMLGRFQGFPQFEWIDSMISNLEDKFHLKGSSETVIGLDGNEYAKGNEFITPLFEAILTKTPLYVTYKTFHKGVRNWTIHPYFLKQYNNRWFLLGMNDDKENQITNIALDRIESIKPSTIGYKPNSIIMDFNEYFEDVIGVSIPVGKKIEKVVLRFSPYRFPYVLSKPIHGSQKTINKEKCMISIEVIPNNELDALLLSYGNDVEILKPQELRTKIAEKVKECAKKYFPMHKDCTDEL